MESNGAEITIGLAQHHAISNASGCSSGYIGVRTQPFCLDRWLVKPDSNELIDLHDQNVGSQRPRSLEPRLMQLLCLLAAAPQRVFSREELMNQLWPRVIVNENSLTRAVSELRKQLAHPDSATRCIDTIPKTGYRLAADCRVREYQEFTASPSMGMLQTLPTGDSGLRWSAFVTSARGIALAASLALAVMLMSVVQLPTSLDGSADNGIALADINVTSQAAFDALLDGRLETVSAQTKGQNGELLVEIDKLNASQPVISRDGGLFAYIRYHDQGSSLILGSTRLPSSPVTVFTTPDSIYNLQWSPVDRALLFAQSPRITPAALLPLDEQASLVLFDLDSFTAKVLFGPDHHSPALDAPGSEAGLNDRHADDAGESHRFKLTALGRTLDWLS
ncbi:MAG: winged helix-turn-helix domain-containing protein [Pseudomonadota bacterium]